MGPFAMHSKGPCTECNGKGERVINACSPCFGSGFIQEQRKLTVTIPPGTACNEVMQFAGVCSDYLEFEEAGDVHITLQEDANDAAYKIFRRISTEDLETTVILSLAESLMGCVIELSNHPGYDGLCIRLPPSFHGDRYALQGYGMPMKNGSYGTLFLTIQVKVSAEERALYISKGREVLTGDFLPRIRPLPSGDIVDITALVAS
jgi:molecular chaperone DnaJ